MSQRAHSNQFVTNNSHLNIIPQTVRRSIHFHPNRWLLWYTVCLFGNWFWESVVNKFIGSRLDFLYLEEEASEGTFFSTVFDLAQHSQSCLPGENKMFFCFFVFFSNYTQMNSLVSWTHSAVEGLTSVEKLGPLFSLLDEKSFTLNTNVHVYNISHILEINVQKYIWGHTNYNHNLGISTYLKKQTNFFLNLSNTSSWN